MNAVRTSVSACGAHDSLAPRAARECAPSAVRVRPKWGGDFGPGIVGLLALQRHAWSAQAGIMQEAPPSKSAPAQDPATRAPKARRRPVVIAVAVVVALIAGGTTLLVLRADDDSAPSGPAAAPSPTVTDLTTPTPTPTTTQPSALEDLAAFLSAAATLNGQLHDAAAAINAAGPPWTDVGPEVAHLVNAADLTPVARAIPAGLPPDLLRSVVLVYSDLAARRASMTGIEYNPPSPGSGTLMTTDEVLLSELRNGHATAARFDSDHAATRALAAATPPIAAIPADSRLVAEKLLLIRDVDKDNFCDVRGGAVFTELPQIVWGPVSWNPDADGTIGGIDFTAEFGVGNWRVDIIAC